MCELFLQWVNLLSWTWGFLINVCIRKSYCVARQVFCELPVIWSPGYWSMEYDTDGILGECFVGRKLWGFPRFAGDCASSHKKCQATKSVEQKIEITDSCSQMILQLHDVYDPNKVSNLLSRMADPGRCDFHWLVYSCYVDKCKDKSCLCFTGWSCGCRGQEDSGKLGCAGQVIFWTNLCCDSVELVFNS